jgi:hypothetical protein
VASGKTVRLRVVGEAAVSDNVDDSRLERDRAADNQTRVEQEAGRRSTERGDRIDLKARLIARSRS